MSPSIQYSVRTIDVAFSGVAAITKFFVTGMLQMPSLSWLRTVMLCTPMFSPLRSTLATDAPSSFRPAMSPSIQYSVRTTDVAWAGVAAMMKFFVVGLLHIPSLSCTRTVML